MPGKFVAAGTAAEGDVEDLLTLGDAPGLGELIQFAIRLLGDREEEGGAYVRQVIGGLEQIDHRAGRWNGFGEIELGPFGKVSVQALRVFVGFRMASERRSDGFCRRSSVPYAGRLAGASYGKFIAQFTQFLKLRSLKPTHLFFQGANAGDLANPGGDAKRQKITRDVEGASGDVPLVGIRASCHRDGATGLRAR